jgi:predicted Rossmann-fold nucleotide-binding protein
MNKIRSICIGCGSSPGAKPEYLDAAGRLGKLLADNSIRIVYGGANIGLWAPLLMLLYKTTGMLLE